MADSLFAVGRYDEARDWALKATRMGVNDRFNRLARSLGTLAAIEAHLGRYREAREAFEEAERLEPRLGRYRTLNQPEGEESARAEGLRIAAQRGVGAWIGFGRQ
jgi:tetratricopeptide (TPR) repeat protein